MRIEADWLERAETQRLMGMLGEAWAVGGCVRNTILDMPVKDIDIATSVLPEEVTRRAEAAGFRAVPTGIEHGTVTVLVGDTPYEVTTFRRDVRTDGRRAVVAFADSLEDDALRRDFTMNAIYADASGQVTDPVGGVADLQARKVRFVEDAERRIREDYLRSLRFFRFSAFYGDGFEAEALDAIARNLSGLETLSRERVGSEVLRLLEAPDPAPAVAAMCSTGVLGVVLPGSDARALAPLVHLEAVSGVGPDPIRRLAVLGGESAAEGLRLSRKQASRLDAMRSAEGGPGMLGYRLGAEDGLDALLVRSASAGVALDAAALRQVSHGAAQTFPIQAADLMPEYEGPALGAELDRLERAWIESGFTLDREALLRQG